MFTYTVQEVHESNLRVLYPDNSIADVPIFEGESKEVIEERIAQFYHPTTEGFTQVESVPFVAGEVGSTKEVSHKPAKDPDLVPFVPEEKLLTYVDLREMAYPTGLDQRHAMFLAREGDSSDLEEIDAEIRRIDLQYPPDMEPVTETAYNAMLEELSAL